MRWGVVVPLCWTAAAAFGWDAQPHRAITRAALDGVLPAVAARIGEETKDIIESYSLLPDRYIEMREFGFERKGAGPHTLEDMQPFCVRPDGGLMHSASFHRDDDLGSVIYLYERILTMMAARKPAETAMFIGVLAHFIEDSLSPPHAVSAQDLEAMAPGEAHLHGKLERWLPAFVIAKRTAPESWPTMLAALESVVDRLYAAAERNRKALPELIAEVRTGDRKLLDERQLRAGKDAAELLADTLNYVLGPR